MEFAAGLTLLQFSGDLRCGCAPRKYCSPIEQQQNIVAKGLRDSCIGLQTCDVFEQPTQAYMLFLCKYCTILVRISIRTPIFAKLVLVVIIEYTCSNVKWINIIVIIYRYSFHHKKDEWLSR